MLILINGDPYILRRKVVVEHFKVKLTSIANTTNAAENAR